MSHYFHVKRSWNKWALTLTWKESDNNLRLNLLQESGDFCPVPGTRAQSKPQICLFKFDKIWTYVQQTCWTPPTHPIFGFFFIWMTCHFPFPMPKGQMPRCWRVWTAVLNTQRQCRLGRRAQEGGRAVTVTGEHLGLLSRVSWTVSSQHPPYYPPTPSCLLRFIIF